MDSMEMPPELAKRLFDEGAFLIIAGVPIGTEFGIDLCSYTIGERFRGVKMIPPGPHYIYCASQGPYGDSAPRVGFVHYFQPQEILVREWDREHEELRKRQVKEPELEIQRIKDNMQDLDKFLAAYDYRSYKQWRNLTSTISEETVKKLNPDCGVIRNDVMLLSCSDADRPRGSATSQQNVHFRKPCDESEMLPNLQPIEGTAPRLSKLPDRIPKDIPPAEISKHHIDCLSAVQQLFNLFESFEILLEEIQLSFVMFQPGCYLEGLSHWRKILNILSNSETAVPQNRLFYMKYLEVVQYQLPELPQELMEPTERNTVFKDVRNLLLNCTLGGLNVCADRISRSLTKSMKWTFDNLLDEDPEDQPVIVET